MYFEGRELKPYAEPVPAAELKKGSVYYMVNFFDEEMLIPCMETLVFLGKNLDENDKDSLYFQDYESYLEGVRHDSATEGDYARIHTFAEDQAQAIFSFEKALENLMSCSLRRRGIKG